MDASMRGRSIVCARFKAVGKKREGNADRSHNSVLERATEIPPLTLDVGVCLRADCTPNEKHKALSAHKPSDKPESGMISEKHTITCSARKAGELLPGNALRAEADPMREESGT